jgi:hypothetical protein
LLRGELPTLRKDDDLRLSQRLAILFARSFFFIYSKGYIGLAPAEVSQDDIIVAFCGLPGPYIIRPISGTLDFQLVGQCYVQGMMDGYDFGRDFGWISLL